MKGARFIFLFMGLLESRSFQNPNHLVVKVWIAILLSAQYRPTRWNGVALMPGQLFTSYRKIAGLVHEDSYYKVQRAVRWLASGDDPEIALESMPARGGVRISIRKWHEYQKQFDAVQGGRAGGLKELNHLPNHDLQEDPKPVVQGGSAGPPAQMPLLPGVTRGLNPSNDKTYKKGRPPACRSLQEYKKTEITSLREARSAPPPENGKEAWEMFGVVIQCWHREKMNRPNFRFPFLYPGQELRQAKQLLKSVDGPQYMTALLYYPRMVSESEWMKAHGGYTWAQFYGQFQKISTEAELNRPDRPSDHGMTREEVEKAKKLAAGALPAVKRMPAPKAWEKGDGR